MENIVSRPPRRSFNNILLIKERALNN